MGGTCQRKMQCMMHWLTRQNDDVQNVAEVEAISSGAYYHNNGTYGLHPIRQSSIIHVAYLFKELF